MDDVKHSILMGHPVQALEALWAGQKVRQQEEDLAALFERMRSKGWPRHDEDPDLCMERAREFLDAADRIYPRG